MCGCISTELILQAVGREVVRTGNGVTVWDCLTQEGTSAVVVCFGFIIESGCVTGDVCVVQMCFSHAFISECL